MTKEWFSCKINASIDSSRNPYFDPSHATLFLFILKFRGDCRHLYEHILKKAIGKHFVSGLVYGPIYTGSQIQPESDLSHIQMESDLTRGSGLKSYSGARVRLRLVLVRMGVEGHLIAHCRGTWSTEVQSCMSQ